MSNFCPKCGNALPEGAVFCGACGSNLAAEPAAPVSEAPAYADPAPVAETPVKAKKEKKPLNVKLIAIIALAALVVVGVVAWILIANPFADPVKPLKDYYAFQYAEELSLSKERALVDGLANDAIKKIYNIYEASNKFKSAEDSWESRIEGYEKNMGDDWDYSYKVIEKYKAPAVSADVYQMQLFNQGVDYLSQAQNLEDLDEDRVENIAEALDIDEDEVWDLIDAMEDLGNALVKADVTECYTIVYTASRSGEELDEDADLDNVTTMTVYKINGKWISTTALSTVMNRVESMLGNF